MSEKDLKRILRGLRRLGFEIEHTKGGHYKVRRNGITLQIIGFSPSDRRYYQNLRADMKRTCGLDIDTL